MHRGPHPPTPELTDTDRATLTAWTRRCTTAQALALRARIILESADHPEASNTEIALKLGICRETARCWRERFIQLGLDGLLDAPRPGAPRTITDEHVERVMSLTLESLPKNATHWSTRSMAAVSGLSQTAISRIWRAFGLRPHLAESFKLPTDPLFIEKVRDIVGLYLSPPDRALVLCVDEKPQIQALERHGHSFPTLPGQSERRAHDYVRHGTTTLFAALDAKVGTVIGQCYPRHRSREFKKFLETVDAAVPADLDVHLILDNYGTHKTQLIRDWLAKRPRYHVHFTPTSGSWLNLVECWFSALSRRRLERGCFASVGALERAIREYVDATNQALKAFVWTRTADEILASVARFCKRISNSDHSVQRQKFCGMYAEARSAKGVQMRPIRLNRLTTAQLQELDQTYRTTRDARVRTRAQMVLLCAEQGRTVPEVATIVRQNEETVRRWLERYQAEGVNGLTDAPRSGAAQGHTQLP